jgi:voltage-gated potassium channel Kch
MARPTRRDRLQYRLDGFMSRGPSVLIVGLFAATLLVVLLIAIVIVAVGWGSESGFNFLDVIWRTFLTTLDPGTVANFLGGTSSPGYLLALLGATLFGVFVTSIFIGILVTAIQGRLEELRKGHSTVIETGHTVILGWSPQIFTILAELIVANANQRRRSIVVLAPRDKVQMEDEIRAQVGRSGHTRIVCRTGSPIDMGDLARASLETAKSVIVLSSDADDPDIDTIKTILAITNGPNRRAQPYHIVAEIHERDSLAVARIVGRDEAQLVVVGDLISRIIAQTCRQSGLSVVYQELLDFEGDEIYEAELPAHLVGRPFRECLFAFDDSTVIGLMRPDGVARLNPPMEAPTALGDRLLVISADDDTVVPGPVSAPASEESLIVRPRQRQRAPEATLVLGWNRYGPSITKELDSYVAPGSRMVVAATPDDLASAPLPADDLVNTTFVARPADPTRRETLVGLCAEGFDHVIVLCSDVLAPQRADARTLVTLVNLRDIVADAGHGFSITSEMLDLRDRALAEVTRADDFIVSDRLASLLLSQLAENARLKAVFDDLFDSAGSEIYLRPASDYVQAGASMTFATVLESSARRGEIAVGYRVAASAADASRAYGVVINPRKSRSITFAPGDRVIVLAQGD